MTRWLYKILRATFRNGAWAILHTEEWVLRATRLVVDDDNRTNEDVTLLVYGEAGWELVSVVDDGDKRTYYLKRPEI